MPAARKAAMVLSRLNAEGLSAWKAFAVTFWYLYCAKLNAMIDRKSQGTVYASKQFGSFAIMLSMHRKCRHNGTIFQC